MPIWRLNIVPHDRISSLIFVTQGVVPSTADCGFEPGPLFSMALGFPSAPPSLACGLLQISHEQTHSINAKNRYSRNPERSGDSARGQDGPNAGGPTRPLVGRTCPPGYGEPAHARVLQGDLPGDAGMREALRRRKGGSVAPARTTVTFVISVLLSFLLFQLSIASQDAVDCGHLEFPV